MIIQTTLISKNNLTNAEQETKFLLNFNEDIFGIENVGDGIVRVYNCYGVCFELRHSFRDLHNRLNQIHNIVNREIEIVNYGREGGL